MPTYTIYSTAADGHIVSQHSTYATARTGGTITVNTTAANDRYVGQGEFFGHYCNELFFDFDTASIPDGETVTAATLSLWGTNDQSTTDFTVEARLFNWGGSLTAADWISGANLGTYTLLATYTTSSGWSNSAYNTFTDVAFPANVDKTGVTYIAVNSSRHRIGNQTPTGTTEQVSAYLAEDSGTTRDPKLVVTTSGGGSPQSVSPTGLSSAQSFGAVTPKASYALSLTGLATAQAFGSITLRTAITRQLTGLASAQGFGAITIRTAITRQVTGLGSAQAFGTPSVVGAEIKPVGGVASAQAFGAIRTAVRFTATGLGSAQAFGTPSFRLTRAVGGVSSAQAFGTPTIRQTKPIGGVSSAQAFGSPTILKGGVIIAVAGVPSAARFGGPAQTVVVPGVYPPGFVPSITGHVLAGDGHLVGGSTAAQFGVPNVYTGSVDLTIPVNGLASAQAFGAITIRVTAPIGGVSSAQAFGSVTTSTTVTLSIAGLGSAQAFGAVSFATSGAVAVAGLGSAQAFGAVAVLATITRSVGSVASAQSFGIPTFRATATVTPAGLGSAQSFGLPTFAQKAPTGGVPSAAQFGVPTVRAPIQVVAVPGVPPSGVYLPTITGQVLTGQAIVGGLTFTQFGRPYVVFDTWRTLPGVPSAQAFGRPEFATGPVTATVDGLGSAQAFGLVSAFIIWLRPSTCTELELGQSTVTELSPAASTCTEAGFGVVTASTTICGEWVCGEGGEISQIPSHDLDLDPSTPVELDLEELVCS